MLFRKPGGYVIALTYGPDTEWVQNVFAWGSCQIEMRGRTHNLVEPRLVRDDRRRIVPWFVRPQLRLLRVSDFLELALADDSRVSSSRNL
jgi:hypothetical protein